MILRHTNNLQIATHSHRPSCCVSCFGTIHRSWWSALPCSTGYRFHWTATSWWTYLAQPDHPPGLQKGHITNLPQAACTRILILASHPQNWHHLWRGLAFRKFQMPLTHVQSWSVTPHHMTPLSFSNHSFGLGPTGQSPCILGSLLICSNTLEQLSLGNQCMPVVRLLWQKLVLFLSLSRVLVDGVLLLLSGICKRILWCYMHSSCCDPCTMTPPQLHQPKCFAFLLILMLNRIKTISSTLSFHTSHSTPSHMLIYSLGHLPKKKKNPIIPSLLFRIIAFSQALYKFNSSSGFRAGELL